MLGSDEADTSALHGDAGSAASLDGSSVASEQLSDGAEGDGEHMVMVLRVWPRGGEHD